MKTSEMIAMLEEYGIKEEPGKYGMPHWVERISVKMPVFWKLISASSGCASVINNFFIGLDVKTRREAN